MNMRFFLALAFANDEIPLKLTTGSVIQLFETYSFKIIIQLPFSILHFTYSIYHIDFILFL